MRVAQVPHTELIMEILVPVFTVAGRPDMWRLNFARIRIIWQQYNLSHHLGCTVNSLSFYELLRLGLETSEIYQHLQHCIKCFGVYLK